MPSPVGHALAGIAAGWLVDRPGTVARTVVFALAGTVADVDLLFGAHSGPTHGLGAAVIAGMLVAVVSRVRLRADATRNAKERAIQFGGAVMAAYASHTLLDWLGTDASPPIGIMALWPFSSDYYESHLHVFRAISRRYWLPEFLTSNARALAGELAILLPLTALVYLARRRPA
jgi:inner membrane protein